MFFSLIALVFPRVLLVFIHVAGVYPWHHFELYAVATYRWPTHELMGPGWALFAGELSAKPEK